MYRQNFYQHNSAMDLIGFHTGIFDKHVESRNYAVKFHELINCSALGSAGLKQLCRFCLKRASKKIDKETLESFKILTNSKLVCKPEYPKSICSLCESQIQSACQLRVSLIDMERCWSEFFRQDYQQFIRSISVSEEHIYDEIFLEIEMDAKDSETSSVRSFDQRPLLRDKNFQQPPSRKTCIGIPRCVQALKMSETTERERTLSDWSNQKRCPTCHQSSDHAMMVTQNTDVAFTAENQSSRSVGFISEDEGMFIERNHDTVSLSNERVDYYLPDENKLDEWNAGGSETNKTEIKCVVVGNAAVGKTNLILSYLRNKFDDQHVPTLSDIYKFDVDVNEQLVQVMLYDTAGQDTLDPLRRLSYPDCNVFLLCFSVVQPESFHAIERKWAPKFRHTNASLVLVGTQTDLRSDSKTIAKLKKLNLRPVASEEARKLARSIGAKYMETSSRNNFGVKDAFDTAVEMAMKKIQTVTVDDDMSTSWKDLLCMCCVG